MSVCGELGLMALMHRDNGEAGAAGQPPPRVFPKGFEESFAGTRILVRSPHGAFAKCGILLAPLPDCSRIAPGHAEGVTRRLHPGYTLSENQLFSSDLI